METCTRLYPSASALIHTLYRSLRRFLYWLSASFALLFLIAGTVFLLSPQSALARAPAASHSSSPDEYHVQGLRAFQQGAFHQAIVSWTEAARFYAQAGKFHEQSDVLTYLARAYQSIGHYKQALHNLGLALALVKDMGDRTRLASVLGSLGDLYIALGPTDTAYEYLSQGLSMARDMGNAAIEAVILNNLGNMFASRNQHSHALGFYRESTRLAKNTGNHALAVRALTNAAKASMESGQHQEAQAQLDMVLEQTQELVDSHDKAYGLLNIGLGYRDLRRHLPDWRDQLLLQAAETFEAVAIVAEAIGDRRAASYAWGYLGQLYEDEHRYQEALQLVRRAIFAAQQTNAPEALYRWQWHAGRLLKAMGRHDDALAAYRRAVQTLQSIRQELAVGYGSPQASFREAVGPIYFELVDLLLQRAASMEKREQYEPYLLEARDTVELFKAAELRDYFQDDCVDAVRSRITRLDILSQSAVIVYPILLPDRTELLLSLPSGLERFAVPVGLAALTHEIRAFRRTLEKRTTRQYLPHAQRLYDWLIRPLEATLTSITVEHLVFVPDGPLRTIPMAALHDGQQFLIHKYAIATTPGLDLTDPRALQREQIKVLAVGLTESVQGFPSLPNVSAELQAIQRLYGGDLLLNQEFVVDNLEKALRDEQFTIVHIASHGRFDSNIGNSFLLTFDGMLSMDRLEQFVGHFKFRDEPLELLTLSACETAAGDDRAALGLAGIAIKAGARSALATLWHVNDPASSLLIAEFYRQLRDPSVSRAMALQHAQMKLLDDFRYQHPGYWSPFILINNWL